MVFAIRILSDAERRVLTISATPLSRDELLGELELGISEANVLLSTMEIRFAESA